MSYLLDTCAISELVKKRPAKQVLEWFRHHETGPFYLSVLTIGEIEKGIHRLPASKKRESLEHWLNHDLRSRFSGYILPISEAIAVRWGILQAEAEARGIPLPSIDGLLAATALEHQLIFVTRNIAPIDSCGVAIENPWR